MKMLLTSGARAIALLIALPLFSAPLHAQLQVTRATPRLDKKSLPKEPNVLNVDVGPSSNVTGLPLADLVVKDAYLDEYGGSQFVNFLIANTGQKDAGFFEVGIKYNYAPGGMIDGRWDLYKVDSLKAGESAWISAAPMCCGWSPTEDVVANTVQFEVIADPKYSKGDAFNPLKPVEVKPRIPESNKANNRFVVNKADIRHGKLVSGMVVKPATPAIGRIKDQSVIKH